MEYRKTIRLKDGRECILRNGTAEDTQAVMENFILTHAQTDYLASNPAENKFTFEQEKAFLQGKVRLPVSLVWVVLRSPQVSN